MAKRGSAALTEQRVEEVFRLLMAGARRADILQFASENQWGVSTRSVENYLQKATLGLLKVVTVRSKTRARLRVAMREELYARAFAEGDWRTALAALKDLDELEGRYPGKEVVLKGKGKGEAIRHEHTFLDIPLERFRELPLAERVRILCAPAAPPPADRG